MLYNITFTAASIYKCPITARDTALPDSMCSTALDANSVPVVSKKLFS